MFGVYFHIPFCKSKCGYCDFYSVASQTLVQPMVEAMLSEMEQRRNYFEIKQVGCHAEPVEALQRGFFPSPHPIDKLRVTTHTAEATLYFGGGTPSLLQPVQIATLAQKATQTFGIKKVVEFTLELNPDDATPEYLQALHDIGVDRLSIGIQSFFDDDLQRVNRRHTVQQAKQSVAEAKKIGFKNISVDLIYGLPQMDLERWQSNLNELFSLDIQHFSAYALSVEERTPFGVQQRKGRLTLPTEAEVAEQSALLDEQSAQHGFLRYEISNFCREGFFSQHNTAYWQQKPYIGVGSSAHSYNGIQRQHNVANNARYIQRMNGGEPFFEVENLTQEQRYNEYIFTGLRTMWGIDLNYIQQVFDKRLYNHCLDNAAKHIDNENIIIKNERLLVPQNRWLIADSIIVDLIWA